MHGGSKMLHILLQQEKTCICSSGKLFTDNTFTAWLKELYHYEVMGGDGLWLLKIANYSFYNLNQLRVLDINNNAIINLAVHVFQGLICLEEVN